MFRTIVDWTQRRGFEEAKESIDTLPSEAVSGFIFICFAFFSFPCEKRKVGIFLNDHNGLDGLKRGWSKLLVLEEEQQREIARTEGDMVMNNY